MHERRNADDTELDELATKVTDPNFRIFADPEFIHVVSRQLHLKTMIPLHCLSR